MWVPRSFQRGQRRLSKRSNICIISKRSNMSNMSNMSNEWYTFSMFKTSEDAFYFFIYFSLVLSYSCCACIRPSLCHRHGRPTQSNQHGFEAEREMASNPLKSFLISLVSSPSSAPGTTPITIQKKKSQRLKRMLRTALLVDVLL